MAQLQPGDKFIVDRGGSTYKTTFQEIEDSLDIDLSYQYTVTVDETAGGAVDASTVTEAGDDFLETETYEFNSDDNTIRIKPTQDGPLVDGGYVVTDNTSGITLNESFSGLAYGDNGAILTLEDETSYVNAPTDIDIDVSFEYTLYQDSIAGADSDIIDPSGGIVRVTGNGAGNTPTVKIIKRGVNYRSGQAIVVRDDNRDFKLNIDTVSDADGPSASIRVDEVSDGLDQDKAQFTIQIGSDPSTAKTVKVTPGRGIAFDPVYDDDDNLLDDEILIRNTLEAGSGGGGGGTDEPPVFVLPTPPNPPTYLIRNGALWYNTSDGRIYIALTYPTDTGFGYDWIDASPSSLNDAVRKDGDTMTGSLYIDGASLYTPHYELERLPLIQNAP